MRCGIQKIFFPTRHFITHSSRRILSGHLAWLLPRLLSGLSALLGACSTQTPKDSPSAFPSEAQQTNPLRDSKPTSSSIRFLAVGDVMTHQRVIRSAEQKGSPENHYYGKLLETLKEDIQKADLAFANLETPVAAKNYFTPRPFVFNASPQLPLALKWLGFDVLSVANNHSLDQGKRGLLDTVEFLRENQIAFIGAGKNFNEAIEGYISLVKNKKIGWIAYTRVDGANWRHALQKDKVWLNINDTDEEIIESLKALKQRSDFVIASIHWGYEYESKPRTWQRDLAKKMHEAGADVILGHHPHVLQPVEVTQINGKSFLTAYSLGNFLSNQGRKTKWPLSSPSNEDERKASQNEGRTRDSILLNFELSDEGLKNIQITPLWTLNPNSSPNIQVVKIDGERKKIEANWIEVQRFWKSDQKLKFLKSKIETLELLKFRLETIENDVGTLLSSDSAHIKSKKLLENGLNELKKALKTAQRSH